jgi:hypothetical protein
MDNTSTSVETNDDAKRCMTPARWLAVVGLCIGLFSLTLLALRPEGKFATPAEPSIEEQVYARLDAVRNKRYSQLQHYLKRIRSLADQASSDPYLRRGFELQLQYYRMRQAEPPPPQARAAMRTLNKGLLAHTVAHYYGFYDLLFVAADGTVIHTIRRNDLRGRNVFDGKLGQTSLARRLRESPSHAFVDFKRSPLAEVPSACFVEPVNTPKGPSGWIVLQCAINNINDIFTRDTSLGRTGETFLVNRNRQMLTNSRFRRRSSILSLHLSPENIESKFAEREGHKVVVDYRGCRAMTSFKVVSVMGSEWLLIAKIDEAEVLTDHYRRHRSQLRDTLLEQVCQQRSCLMNANESPAPPQPQDAIAVGMDEYRAADAGESLQTFGVSSCTAVVAHLPGRFAYLGHASSYDAMYGGGDLDLLSNMIQRIRTYEIRPYEMRQLRIVIAAPHTESLGFLIDRLVDEGIFLAQIRFLHLPSAARADIWHEVDTGCTTVHWTPRTSELAAYVQRASDTPRIGEIARQLWLPASTE